MSTVAISQENKTTLPEEFERLYREHATFVYRTALRITRNAEEAEDILQIIFLRLLRRESSRSSETSASVSLPRCGKRRAGYDRVAKESI